MHDFETLYGRYGQDVFRFALYLCGNRADAEDIAAETFARAWMSRDRLRLPTVKGYLFAIARNLHRMGWRSQKPRRELDASLPDGRPGPHLEAEGRDQLARVLAALQEMPETDRAAVLMRAQDGMSHAEIARALGLTEVAVKVKVHRARLRLQALRTGEGR
ncbi:MAG: sigma-70 family RNA polymerase sigma factor [Vicinamibacteria bacterium]